jgi:hypothetical protein
MSSLSEKILKWSENDENSKYIILNHLLEYLGENLYFDYEPSSGPYHDFTSRLNSWLENVVNEEDQKLLFELAERIFYVGREEFKSLNRTAFNSVAKRWLVDKLGVEFENIDFDKLLAEAINSTWFCPITDSFRINQFYHVNQITSQHTFRPDWRSLKKFGSEEKIKNYISVSNVKYIVLLEDFVGTGTQALPSLKFASSLSTHIKVLFIPLILCPSGYSYINGEMQEYENFALKPVILLKETDLINRNTVTELKLEVLSELIERVFDKVKGNPEIKKIKAIGPYGYKSTGGLTIMYGNAPNNSLPLILVESNTWAPLFKRHSRD